MKKIILDERQNNCPLPVVHVKEAIINNDNGDIINVKVNDIAKKENIKRLCDNLNCKYTINEIDSDEIDIEIIISKEKLSTSSSCDNYTSKEFIIVISSDRMGDGDEVLSKNLLKAFLFAVTKQEALPKTIIFYNRGAFVTTEYSECIETLKELENANVEIFTCGTCLDFYKLKDNLKVGKVTNMYDIVNMMERASKVIKL